VLRLKGQSPRYTGARQGLTLERYALHRLGKALVQLPVGKARVLLAAENPQGTSGGIGESEIAPRPQLAGQRGQYVLERNGVPVDAGLVDLLDGVDVVVDGAEARERLHAGGAGFEEVHPQSDGVLAGEGQGTFLW
jgi:hypothetical protein